MNGTGAEICSLPVEWAWGAQAVMNGPMGTAQFRTDLISAHTQHDFRNLKKYLINIFPLLIPKVWKLKQLCQSLFLWKREQNLTWNLRDKICHVAFEVEYFFPLRKKRGKTLSWFQFQLLPIYFFLQYPQYKRLVPRSI